ncbi:ABC transporter permease [Brevibacterium album]|uniref:ABC transporter permease n=1 Tax=Brevibacterium album TaxID=417948 RepID=UPI000406CDCB|nr:ABC transporter permease [Brevibacterium album]
MTQSQQHPPAVAAVEAPALVSRRSTLRTPLRQGTAVAALVYLLLVLVIAVLAPWIAPHDPAAQDLSNGFAPLSGEHLLGTDRYGRDVLSQILSATRVALVSPLIAVGIAVLVGIPAGLLAGMRGGRTDSALSALADTLLSVPAIVFALAIVAVLGQGLTNAMLAVGIVLSPTLFRVVRGATMVVCEETFILSARAIGSGSVRIMLRNVLPNIAAPVLVQVTLLMAISLLAEAALSFLGLGMQPPAVSWGSMLRAAYESQFDAPWAVVAPGVAIVLTVLSFNTLGDALRDALSGGDSND